MPLFTIITVTYNSEKTIQRTITSVLNQILDDYEYVIIDGDSSDMTCNIIQRNVSSFNGKLKWLSEPDTGIYDAMNKGISRAKGQYIVIINSDDWLEPNALHNILCAINLQSQSDECVYCGYVNYHYLNEETQLLTTDHYRLRNKAKKLEAGVRFPAMIVPIQIYNKLGLYDENLKKHADVDFILRCFYANITFVFIDKVLSNMSDGGLSTLNLMKSLDEQKIIAKRYAHSIIDYFFNMALWVIKRMFRTIVPHRLMVMYRKIY